ncbi:MAG: hypothetical protein COU27_02140 [Candidatus Levybacteria bacterium CG10_big_fil_rev_8_21_14_0_10_36_7]|nr:MAG: hypothetical protein COU27_02140 [Candidatus Levybacteria bacterium CG10_big_fil_rev_8_21_14_0_10_36_7]
MFLQTKNKKNRKSVWLAGFLVIVFSLITFHKPTKKAVSSALIKIATPLFRAGDFVGKWVEGKGFVFKDKQSLLDENLVLKERNMELENRQILFSFLEEENKNLKALFLSTEGREYILASIVSRPPQSPYDILIIDSGLEQGIREGMLVTAYGSVLIGHISEVYQRESKVKLISFPGETTNLFLQKINLAITSIGKGGENLEINLPNSIEISSGNSIMTEGNFPLIAGFVERIEVNLSDPFQKVFFRLPVNLHNLRNVMVEKKKDVE